jgi:beta-glucosidase
LNYFIPGTVTYLTRADWNTFPEAIKNVTATAEIKDLMENSQYEKPADAPNISAFKFGQKNGLTFLDMKDVPFDDNETWDKFVDQLTVNELCQVLGDQMGVAAFKSVNMPAYSGGDGPDGHQGGALFNAEVVIASTFSKERITERGFYFAEESYYIGFRHIYAPGANLHRTPYSGRNFEYYSEDANMSYICGAVQTGEMARKGLVTTIKHFAGNDQETNRHGVATFMTEQTYRQGPLKGFEGALADDNSLALMTAFNRIGCKPTAADYETMQTVLREEWGFKGINMTDSSKDSVSYMSTEDCIHAGSELFNNDPNRSNDAKKLLINVKDGYMWSRVRDAAKHYFYAMSRSNHINGLSNEVEVQDFVPWWQPATIGVCATVGVLTLASAVMFVVTAYGRKKEA